MLQVLNAIERIFIVGARRQHDDNRAGSTDHDGIDKHANHLHDPLRCRVRRPGGGGRGGVRRRTHPCFIGEHAALEATGQCLADGVAHRAGGGFLPAEGAAKDGGKNGRQGSDVPQADEQTGGDPQQRHDGHQPLHQARHAAQATENGQENENGQHAAADCRWQIERIVHGMGHRVGLHGIKDKSIGQQQKDRKQDTHPAHAETARHIPRRAAAKLSLAVALFV